MGGCMREHIIIIRYFHRVPEPAVEERRGARGNLHEGESVI